jgi:hypothetical protein
MANKAAMSMTAPYITPFREFCSLFLHPLMRISGPATRSAAGANETRDEASDRCTEDDLGRVWVTGDDQMSEFNEADGEKYHTAQECRVSVTVIPRI